MANPYSWDTVFTSEGWPTWLFTQGAHWARVSQQDSDFQLFLLRLAAAEILLSSFSLPSTLSLESPPHMCGSKSPWVWGDLMHRFEAPSAASSFPGHPICISSHTGSPKPHPPASGTGFLLDRLVRILPVRATTTVPGLRAPGFDF